MLGFFFFTAVICLGLAVAGWFADRPLGREYDHE